MLIGHGTRDSEGTEQFFELGARLAERLAPQPVVPCLLEFQRPTIPEAWNQLVERGVEHIYVAPLLLFAAGHAKQDIPQIIDECRERTPQISVEQSCPISRHRSIIELVRQRITEALQRSGADPSECAVVMVGRGSHDPCAQTDMKVLAEVAGHQLGVANVSSCFYAMASPRLPETLERVVASGRYRTIIVYPHLLFAGRLFEAISRQLGEAAERFPQRQFELAQYLGPDPLVADALAARIGQTIAV